MVDDITSPPVRAALALGGMDGCHFNLARSFGASSSHFADVLLFEGFSAQQPSSNGLLAALSPADVERAVDVMSESFDIFKGSIRADVVSLLRDWSSLVKASLAVAPGDTDMMRFKRQVLHEYCHAKLGTPRPAELDATTSGEGGNIDPELLAAVGRKIQHIVAG